MTFRVGQRVVCVNSTRAGGYGDEVYPVEGRVYTVRGFLPLPCDHGPRIWLEEIKNKKRDYFEGLYEKAFGAERFRPIVERKTDIGFAHEILRKATRKRGVNA